MNPILSSLNTTAAKTLTKGNLGANLRVDMGTSGTMNRFSDIMAQKNAEQMNSLQGFADQSFDVEGTGKATSISAADINIAVDNPSELKAHAVESDKNVMTNYLSEINGNMNQMNQLIDVVNAGTPLSQRDLIAIQIFMGRSALTTETFTRGGEQVGKMVQNLFNMQV